MYVVCKRECEHGRLEDHHYLFLYFVHNYLQVKSYCVKILFIIIIINNNNVNMKWRAS